MVMKTWTRSSNLWKSIMENIFHFKSDNFLLFFSIKNTRPQTQCNNQTSVCLCSAQCTCKQGRETSFFSREAPLINLEISEHSETTEIGRRKSNTPLFHMEWKNVWKISSLPGHNYFHRIHFLFNYDEVIFLKQSLLEQNVCWMQSEWVLLIIWSSWRLMLFVLSSLSYNFCKRQTQPQIFFCMNES